MITKTLQFINDNEEKVPFQSSQFLYYADGFEISKYYGSFVPWHWHKAIEFSWVLQGKLRVKTNHGEEILSAGEGCFINSNFLHYYEALPGTECIYFSQVFDSSILAGTADSIFGVKYVQPILNACDLEIFSLRPVESRQRKILELLRLTQDISDQKDFGFEFKIRNYLSEIWLLLYQEVENMLGNSRRNDTAELRIKLMMSYIQNYFSEKLSLEDIASSADVSTRECLRCFRTALSKTPFQYLMEYRVQAAADLLVTKDFSITEIGEMCGFSSPSYFTKVFKKIMGEVPGDFRKKHKVP